MGSELQVFFEEKGRLVEERLGQLLAEKKNQFKDGEDEEMTSLMELLFEGMANYVRGGKKVRGGMVMLGYELAGKESNQVLDIAVAIEVMHGFLLVQDDIMDRDEMRRGKTTLHLAIKQWAMERGFGDAGHYGQSVAMTVSDLLHFWGSELFFGTQIDVKKTNEGWLLWVKVLEKTAMGQIKDVSYESRRELDEEQILEMHEWKTGVYTISGPMKLGFLLGGGDESKLTAIESYGKNVGIAFQLVDDDLGIFGEMSKTGKGNDGDVRVNKHTLLKKKLFEVVSEEDKRWLGGIFGNKDLTNQDMERVRDLFDKTGTRQWIKNKANGFCDVGKMEIEKITSDGRLQKILGQFGDYVLNRDK